MKAYSVTDFTGALAAADSADAVWRLSTAFFDQYELDGLVYLDANGHDFTLRSTLPACWHHHYLEQGYAEIDPFAEVCCTDFSMIATGAANIGLHSDMSAAQHRLVHEAGETGFQAGFSSAFRLRSAKGFGGWNLMSSAGKKTNDAIRKEHGDVLHLAAFCAHQTLENPAGAAKPSPLSPREAECLQWLASGLRTQQIAHQMQLKPVTIEYHFRKAREKLGVKTREHALATAISRSYIDL